MLGYRVLEVGPNVAGVLGNTVNGASLYENYLRVLSFAVYKIFLWKQALSNPDGFTPAYFEAMRLQSRAPYFNGQIVDPIEMHNKSIQKLLNYNNTVQGISENEWRTSLGYW